MLFIIATLFLAAGPCSLTQARADAPLRASRLLIHSSRMADKEEDFDEDEEEEEEEGEDGEEEDDDDLDGEDEDNEVNEEGDAGLEPTMLGELSVAEGRLWWAGRWAVTEGALEDGASSKFKYGGPPAEEADLDKPPSGTWNGYFMNPGEDGEAAKVREKGVVINFDKTDDATVVVSGEGCNDFGDFRLHGTYIASKRTLQVFKQYSAIKQDDDEDDDEIDDDAVDDNYDEELAGLKEEQDMPIEELARRYAYYGDAPPQPPSKKAKT